MAQLVTPSLYSEGGSAGRVESRGTSTSNSSNKEGERVGKEARERHPIILRVSTERGKEGKEASDAQFVQRSWESEGGKERTAGRAGQLSIIKRFTAGGKTGSEERREHCSMSISSQCVGKGGRVAEGRAS